MSKFHPNKLLYSETFPKGKLCTTILGARLLLQNNLFARLLECLAPEVSTSSLEGLLLSTCQCERVNVVFFSSEAIPQFVNSLTVTSTKWAVYLRLPSLLCSIHLTVTTFFHCPTMILAIWTTKCIHEATFSQFNFCRCNAAKLGLEGAEVLASQEQVSTNFLKKKIKSL